MYTETILRTLGEQLRTELLNAPASVGSAKPVTEERDSTQLGIVAVGNFLKQIGVAPDAVVQDEDAASDRHSARDPSAGAAAAARRGHLLARR